MLSSPAESSGVGPGPQLADPRGERRRTRLRTGAAGPELERRPRRCPRDREERGGPGSQTPNAPSLPRKRLPSGARETARREPGAFAQKGGGGHSGEFLWLPL